MNKSAIKGFSVRARRKLIEDISQKAYALGIKDTEKYDEIEEFEGGFRVKDTVNQIVYPMAAKKDREKLISEINRKGFEQVIEEVAYTWFNRIIAIRFMEVNEYLPVKVRFLSSETPNKIEPDILTYIYDYVDELELDGAKVFNLKENHKDEELFKYVFVRECNNLGNLMPQVFEAIGDYTELLLPDQLLVSGSVIRDLVESIEENDFKEEVEIIGWMYQYYISEKKDEVFAALKKNKKITKENIPAATQLFTPKWIVKYMTENSLGRLWQESHPNEDLKSKWEYYIEPAEQEIEVQKKLDALKNPNLSPEEIKILDPAMGSGHILVYAFDVLYYIYLSRGYAERDIPQLILEKNLYGLDIDDRAAQLATFALLMKARSRNRRFFRKSIELNLCSIQESNGFSKEALKYLINKNETQIEKRVHLDHANYIVELFEDSKEYGSILHVDEIDFDVLDKRMNEIEIGNNLDVFEFSYRNEILNTMPNLLKQAKIMSAKYDVIISNPPYMASSNMNSCLSNYLSTVYQDSKADLYAVFIEKCMNYAKREGVVAMITQQTWMFLSTYERFRLKVLQNHFSSLVHLGIKAFEEIGNDVVQTCSFIFRKNRIENFKTSCYRLVNQKDSRLKEETFLSRGNEYISDFGRFNEIPGTLIAYWVPNAFIDNFRIGEKLESFGEFTGSQNITGNNNKYLRYFWEVENRKIKSNDWVFYAKGGDYRKYFGNLSLVIDWRSSAREFYKTNKTSNLLKEEFWFKGGITYSAVTSRGTGFRYLPKGCIFDKGGPTITLKKNIYKIIALLNSKVAAYYFNVFNPSINLQVKDVKSFPLILSQENLVEELARSNIEIAENDWNDYETSFNFNTHPLISFKEKSISDAFENWSRYKESNLRQITENEELINKEIIKDYQLCDLIELKYEERDFPVRLADVENDIKSFVSYFVGNVFGRYSLDQEGVIYTDGEFDSSQYTKFVPVEDNLLLITDEDYFENDILHRLVEFMRKIFGEDALEENLKYISEALNPKSKETSRQTIRNYFVKDFYKDHCKMYKKRPIYWMIDSGKQNGVKALFYMHRYDKSRIARFRTDYLHEIQRYYDNDIELTMKTNDKKRVDKLKKKLQEVTEFDKVVAHIAHQQIEFDLDDGVEHNYELFQSIEVPQGDGQKPLKANLLAKRK